MNGKPLVSIIVPVFNNEASLPVCLESLLSQRLREVEIVIVDDASTDGSAAIADDFAKRDSRLRLFHNQRNLGPFAARNKGFSCARGAYLLPCDADDRLPPDAAATLVATARRSGADIVHGRTRILHGGDAGGRLHICDPFTVTNGQDYVRAFLRNIRGWSLWGKLYSDTLWNRAKCRLPADKTWRVAEDLFTSFVFGLEAGTYAECGQTVYFYRMPATHGFADPHLALARFADHCEVLALMLRLAMETDQSKRLSGLVERLMRHVAISAWANFPDDPALRAAAVAMTTQVLKRYDIPSGCFDALGRGDSGSTRNGLSHMADLAAKGFCHIRHGGWRETRIAMLRILSASAKRGWKRVAREAARL